MQDIRKIPLTRGKFAVVDAVDYEFLMQWKWHAHRNRAGGIWYALTQGPRKNYARKRIYMHKLLVCGSVVDHINGDGLDNRRSNLRVVTRSQNQWNRYVNRDSNLRYDTRPGRIRRWCVSVQHAGKKHFAGYFHTKAAAIVARDLILKDLRGMYGRR